MNSTFVIWACAALAAIGPATPAWAEPAAATCQSCHENQVHAASYRASVHQDLACTACHAPDRALPLPDAGTATCVSTFKPMDCSRCHAKAAKEHANSVHNSKRLPIDCARCHSDIHAITSHKDDKRAIAETCSGCHAHQDDFYGSVHAKALERGNPDAPTCTDCHGMHTVQRIDNDAKGRTFHTDACLKCHDDAEKMARNKVTAIAAETYFASFHGKNVHLGYPEQVAGCADCHTAHAVRKADDPMSSVHRDNLVQTCGTCHKHAGPSFTAYIPHAEETDRAKYPALYWTRLAMTGLLVGTFLFFWLHSVLWAFRAFVDRQRTPPHATPAVPHKTYRRFTAGQIALHIVVVVSFLTLALTGLPLKFSGTGWSRSILAAVGGASRAHAVHHAAAVVTFGYFAVALVMSWRFLWRKHNGRRQIWARLTGPDSLFPTWQDWRDFQAMVRWFTFRGPKPTFDRWTYWEKFDFLAVFWGMFAIGTSGLLLWFPEFFAQFLPGWMFNLATIVHSDEALLATGFIFTVHFFNTHFRPDKFPMDTVIFNGRETEEELREARGRQWQRYEAEGRLAELEVAQPSPLWWEVAFRLFGFLAVATGLSLAVGMIVALVTGQSAP